MSKTMSQTIRGHNLRATMVMALLAVLLLLTLVVVIEPADTTSSRDENPAISGTGGESFTHHHPYIARCTDDDPSAVIARYHQGSTASGWPVLASGEGRRRCQ
jgi:hypothetical protein